MQSAAVSDKSELGTISQRSSPLTMGLLWITMVTIVPGVLVGFDWFKAGLSLSQVLTCTILSCLFLLAYTIPVAYLSAVTGKGYGELNLSVFGKKAASLINFNLVWMFVCWYGLAALLMAEGLNGLFKWTYPIAIIAVSMAVAMAFNNFFGFKGVANFARFVAAPILVLWVGYTFFKTLPHFQPTILLEPSTRSMSYAVTTISNFIIGVFIWGNEADYWRYSKPKVSSAAIPIAVAFTIGMIIFPVTGWLVAKMTGITDYALATEFMNHFSFADIPILGAFVLFAAYFASNDSNLFGSASALENIFSLRHRNAVAILAFCGSIMAAVFSLLGGAKAIETVASLNCIILPTPTIIVLAEWFLASKIFKVSAVFLYSTEYRQKYGGGRAAVIALALGLSSGLLMSGVIPGTESLHVGICPLQSWLITLLVYVPLRLREYTRCMSGGVVEEQSLPVANRDLEVVASTYSPI